MTRFSPDWNAEDLSLQFQVWSVKSYVSHVPLFVNVLYKRSAERIAPFLHPQRDVCVSLEQARHRLLALSSLFPGLYVNILVYFSITYFLSSVISKAEMRLKSVVVIKSVLTVCKRKFYEFFLRW